MLDYGIGNLHSAQKALEKCGADARLTADAGLIRDAAGVVLPGVGAFGACMDALRGAGSEDDAHASVSSGRPFLGICVGMQMLFTRLGGIRPTARASASSTAPSRWIPAGPKIPQMQWNRLQIRRDDPMFAGLGDDAWVYFVHSLHGVPDDPEVVAATVEYGTTIDAAFRSGNVFAAQFHPEKSSRPGLRLLENFVDICRARGVIDLYPAIDLLGGRVVRLRTGDYDDQTVYGDDPVAVARDFAAAGATWIHVVDLDAAKSGDPVNRPVVAAIVAAVASTCEGADGWRSTDVGRRRRTRRAGRRSRRDGIGGGRATRASLPTPRSSCPSRSGSTTVAANSRFPAGPSAVAATSTTPTGCFRRRLRSSSPTSTATACSVGPTSRAWPSRCGGRRPR